MIDALAPVLAGPLDYLRDQLFPVGEGDADALPIRDLLERGGLDAMLANFLPLYEGADRRAVISMWSQWYFSMLIPPIVCATLLHDISVPLALDDVKLALDEQGCPKALYLQPPRSGPSSGSRPCGWRHRFAPLIRDHLDPFIVRFARHSGTAQRLHWTNAALRIAETTRIAAGMPGSPAGCATCHDALFGGECWPDGWRNPLYRTIRYVDDGAAGLGCRQRTCCLAYLLPEYSHCASCPLPDSDRRSPSFEKM